MGKGNTTENDLMKFMFNATAMPSYGANLYLALHNADPTDTGTQETNETNYTNYTYWVKIGGTTPSSNMLTYDGSIVGDNNTTTFAIVHDLSTMKQNIEIWDASSNETIYPAITKGVSTNYISFHTPPTTGTIYDITIIGF